MAHDVIGDIHGHADRLKALLEKLGYYHRGGAWRHGDRSAIFVGDLIDRGPRQVRTLQIVRSMIDPGSARATMGNHEFNAIAWATPDRVNNGHYLRPRHGDKGEKNRRQHDAFLADVGEDTLEHREWIGWMAALPVWIEDPDFRVVHACWSLAQVEALKPFLNEANQLTPEAVEQASRKGHPAHAAIETLLKGEEVKLPDGISFHDKDGNERREVRTKWWDARLTTYRSAYIGLKTEFVPDVEIEGRTSLPEPDRPTFIGHYWLNAALRLEPRSNRVACVDFSAGKGGPLVADRYQCEAELSARNFIAD